MTSASTGRSGGGHHHHHHSSGRSRATADTSSPPRRAPHAFDLRNIGSYENALKTFHQYDLDKDGRFSWRELHTLMTDLNVSKGIRWTDAMNDDLFHRLDRRQDGAVSIDEFIQYIFPKSDAMGGNAGSSGYEIVLEAFRKHDANRNGILEKDEFTSLMCALHPGQWDRVRTDQVFNLIDKDHNGTIESDELVAWIFGVPRDREKAARRAEKARDTSGKDITYVVIEVQCGSGADYVVNKMKSRWRDRFGDQVTVKVNVIGTSSKIQRVSAREGGVVFWDAAKMMAYRDDPFANHTSTSAWLEDMTKRHIPRLIQGTAA